MSNTHRKWSKKQAVRYAERIMEKFPIKWDITFYFDENQPAWVDVTPPDPEWSVIGQYHVICEAAREAEIWISLDQSANGRTKDTIWHEMLHVLFHSAGIDACDTENAAQSWGIHQIVTSLATAFAEVF